MASTDDRLKEWLKSPEYAESQQRFTAQTAETRREMTFDLNEIIVMFSLYHMECKDISDINVVKLVKRYQAFITKYSFSCSNKALANLGKSYAENAAFIAVFDRFGKGTAQYIYDAITFYCNNETER